MNNFSWEEPPYHNSSEYKKLCEKSTVKDFYFYAGLYNNETMVCIVPKLFFNQEKCMWDQSMFLDHILPDSLFEEMESVWGTDESPEEIRQKMLSLGFEENAEFSEMVKDEYDAGF